MDKSKTTYNLSRVVLRMVDEMYIKGLQGALKRTRTEIVSKAIEAMYASEFKCQMCHKPWVETVTDERGVVFYCEDHADE